MEAEEENGCRHLLLYASITIGIICCIVSFTRITLLNILTPFIEPFLELFLFFVLFTVSIISFFFSVFGVRKYGWKAFGPIAVNVLTFFLVFFFPFEEISTALDFKINMSAREKVVSMIQAGELTVNESSRLISLPPMCKYLSANEGKVLVEQDGETLKVFFYTYCGPLDNFMGFAFISDNTPLMNDSFRGDFKVIKKKKDHWFWGFSI